MEDVLGFNVEYISTYKGQYDETDETMVEDIDRKEVLESDDRVTFLKYPYCMRHMYLSNNLYQTFCYNRKEVLESDDRVALVANHIISHHTGKTRIKGNLNSYLHIKCSAVWSQILSGTC